MTTASLDVRVPARWLGVMARLPLLTFVMRYDSAVAVGRRRRKRTRQRPLGNSCSMTSVIMADSDAQPRGGTLIRHEGESIEAAVVALAMRDGELRSGRWLLWEPRLGYQYELLSSKDGAYIYHDIVTTVACHIRPGCIMVCNAIRLNASIMILSWPNRKSVNRRGLRTSHVHGMHANQQLEPSACWRYACQRAHDEVRPLLART